MEDKGLAPISGISLDVLNYDMAGIFSPAWASASGGSFCFLRRREIDPVAKVNILSRRSLRQFDSNVVSDDYLYE